MTQNPKMTPDRWKQLDQLLDAAFALPPEQVPVFLDQACAGDEGLRQELERLLIADERAENFIESRVLDGETQSSGGTLFSVLTGSHDSASPFSGQSFLADRYQFVGRLGKGGMGEVWHAFDVRLRMDVALKSLRVDLRTNPKAVEILRREVRIAREVLSPNTSRIFDLVVVDQNLELISMEFIDGITLSEMLAQSGPLELLRARDIAAQFLSGLEAIHQAGLVHRDLKPENIMVTRTGRVVVMDFGISQKIAEMTGTVAGSPPYMSPEQLSGSSIDGRSDLFAAGIVLAEMIHTKGALDRQAREMIWHAIRVDAKRIPESPWKPVILRAVALNREERYQSVGELIRALEEVTQQVEGMDEQRPYPGLASFTASDAAYFFGREPEIESVIKKMERFQMLAIIGPSGAGKTSFLRAGLIPALPADWCTVFTTPGDSPIMNLAQSLSRSIGDANQISDPDGAVIAFRRLHQSRKVIVLIVDRFEELFTLNTPEVQRRYADILSRLSLEADVRLVLSMRDDFLIACKGHDSLAPIFSELTALIPLTGAALRRALVQPALKCGYRFEDESMVDRILADVENERGVLPLIAFAAARLWEKRDRQKGLLTWQAYKEIGGVSGALAQYAERLLEQMSPERCSIVREIFRNLVTVHNTRVARDVDELMSVFPDQHSAREVLRTLIDARLLTSFEAPSSDRDAMHRRVEVIHESLLSSWPRLLHWQTQDAEAAQLRDQLRHAAQVWEQRNRSEDLLWTGAAFLEYRAWRQRYPGRLTSGEEAFAEAMAHRAGRTRRKRRITLTTIFIVLLAVLITTSVLWRNASRARDEAALGARRAEAGRILAVARSLPDADPSTRIAYALRSLEFAESAEAREFAMQSLAEGPVYRAIEAQAFAIEMSPDGKRIAASLPGGALKLFPGNGTQPNESDLPAQMHLPWYPQFSPDEEQLIWTWRKNTSVIKVWSMSNKKVSRTFNFEGLTICFVRGGKAFFITDNKGKTDPPFFWNMCIVRVWDFGPGEPEILGRINLEGNLWKFFDIDPFGRSIAYAKENGVYLNEFHSLEIGNARLIGTHSAKTRVIRFKPNGRGIASTDEKGEIRLWSLDVPSNSPLWTIPGTGQPLFNFWFDPDGTSIMTSRDGRILRWDLTASADTEPLAWRGRGNFATFDRNHRVLVLADGSRIAFYDYRPPDFYTFHGELTTQGSSAIRFMPDGKSFISGFSEDGIRIRKMPGEASMSSRDLGNPEMWDGNSLDVDPHGRYVAVPTVGRGVHLISISDAKGIPLKGISKSRIYSSIAFSLDGRCMAAGLSAIGENGIEIWDLNSGSSLILENNKLIQIMKFSPDGTLFSGDSYGNLRRWNLTDDSSVIIGAGTGKGAITGLAISHDGRFVVASTTLGANSELRLYDLPAGTSSVISSHGNRVYSVAFDARASKLVTGDYDGVVRVGPITGETPNLLFGHEGIVGDVAVHPNGKWILSSALNNPTVRLWRMPAERPLQTLSGDEFQNMLRGLTNVRVIANENLPGGYGIQLAPFPGWKK